jgi:low temperature requirement protein LtrA
LQPGGKIVTISTCFGDVSATRVTIVGEDRGRTGSVSEAVPCHHLGTLAPANKRRGLLALAINFGGPFVFGVLGFKIHAGHFVERHGLIIIIALGESIVAIGVGASEVGLGAGVILASLLGVAVAASLWWAYFDYVVLLAERRLSGARGHERARLARDSYSYLHLPMLAGIVFVALGVKKTLAHIGDPLGTIPAVALCGGVALYLLGHNAFRLRDAGSVSVLRLVVAALSCALIPLGTQAPAILTLGTLAALLVAFVAAETLYWREDRGKLRTH